MSTKTHPLRQQATTSFRNGQPAPSDEALIASIANGDQGALRTLFTRHHSRIFRFALRFVKEHDAAESVVNDTFLIVWQQAGQFEGRSLVATWLLGIARYRAMGMMKPRRARCEPLDAQHEATLVDHGERADDRLQREDTNRYLRRCLDALPREQAELIELHYFRGVSLNDAVMLTGVPINTIKTRMYLARRKLAKMMDAEDHAAVSPAMMFARA